MIPDTEMTLYPVDRPYVILGVGQSFRPSRTVTDMVVVKAKDSTSYGQPQSRHSVAH